MLSIVNVCVVCTLVALYTTLNQLCFGQVTVAHQQYEQTESQPNILSLIHDDFVWNKQTLYLTSQLVQSTNSIQSTNDPVKIATRHKRSSLLASNKPLHLKTQPTLHNTNTINLFKTQAKTFDACQSDMELITPYFAKNSRGKLRVVVNTELLQQAIQIETCRCFGDCGCEQKYKWHRLLAHDPSNQTRGLFTDWFLYPSTCVCRCLSSSSAQFVKVLKPQTTSNLQQQH